MRIMLLSDALSTHTQRWCAAWRERGHEVHLVSFRGANLPGITLHKLNTYGLGRLGYFLAIPQLRYLVSAIHPDITHANYVTSYGFIAAAAGLSPLVTTAWGTDVLISPWKSRFYFHLAKYALAKADAVTTVAEHMNESVARLGVPESNIVCLPFGVDTDLFAYSPRRRQDMTSPWRVISTRNFEPIYDVRALLDAAGILSRKGISFELVLVGSGSLEGDLRRRAIEIGIADKVLFTGRIEHGSLPKLLASADVFVTPARSDGNNISLNEAMSVGCFPIATDIPANSQWISHGVNGYLYPAGDPNALAGMLEITFKNSALIPQATLANRDIVEKRASWQRCITATEALFMRLIPT